MKNNTSIPVSPINVLFSVATEGKEIRCRLKGQAKFSIKGIGITQKILINKKSTQR